MSYSRLKVIIGIPKTKEIAAKIAEWEYNDDSRWHENEEGVCGFTDLYSASGPSNGYCGVEITEIQPYGYSHVKDYILNPTPAQKSKALGLISKLDPEIKKIMPVISIYFIWYES
jgi:hypothetical protein